MGSARKFLGVCAIVLFEATQRLLFFVFDLDFFFDGVSRLLCVFCYVSCVVCVAYFVLITTGLSNHSFVPLQDVCMRV